MKKPISASDKLRALLAKKIQASESSPTDPPKIIIPEISPAPGQIVLNSEQSLAVQYAREGVSFALTGPAGSGKTTTVRYSIQAMLENPEFPILNAHVHKYLPSAGVPGIAIVAFTNKAVSVVRKNLDPSLHKNCLTIHKFLEVAPVEEAYEDEKGNMQTKMAWRPQRHEGHPISSQIHTLIIEEASMVPVDLWNLIWKACPYVKQFIFIGDIQQLPPVFGKSIYIHAMSAGIRTVELVQVHRQALNSPILKLAHRILEGKQLPAAQFSEYSIDCGPDGRVLIKPWKKRVTDIVALRNMDILLPQWIDSGELNPETDIILTPYNVNFGQIALNEIVATKHARNLGAEIYEIFAGIHKRYFRVGERILFQKREGRIKSIKPNPTYVGKQPRKPSSTMCYKGIEHDKTKLIPFEITEEEQAAHEARIDAILSGLETHVQEDSPTARAASHVIEIEDIDTGEIQEIRTAGEVSDCVLGYAMTVHKSQGSEYQKVFLITHSSQATAIYRELLYTAVTRAKHELVIVCEPNTFMKGISTQKYPGKNVKEKIEAFEKLPMSKNIDYVPQGLKKLIGELETES